MKNSNENLSSLKINDEKIIVISGALKINSSLNSINLENNNIGDEGIKYLSESLKTNSSLKEIDLFNHNIGDEGANYILDSLSFNNSITKIDLKDNFKINENLKKKIYLIVEENLKNSKIIKQIKLSSIVLVKNKMKNLIKFNKTFKFKKILKKENKSRKRRI